MQKKGGMHKKSSENFGVMEEMAYLCSTTYDNNTQIIQYRTTHV